MPIAIHVNGADQPVPQYNDLPELVPGIKCSWDYFNSETKGKHDELGTLNFITNKRRHDAMSEVITGRTVSLDLPIDHFADNASAFGGRKPPQHNLIRSVPFSFDDSISMNTQSASQWDGFRHFGVEKDGEYFFYNGCTALDIERGNKIGIDAWVKRGGIVGRGVLIDFARWAESQGEVVDVNGGRAISLKDILDILLYQDTQISPGDILIFRTGWLDWYNKALPHDRHLELCGCHAPGTHSFIGIEASKDIVEWLWNNQISAVAGDQVAFESTGTATDFGMLHGHLLAGLGCPMGELWDTETLGEACVERQKWTFLLNSMPLHLPGGVASPSNAVAML